jgi:hypothetical protein
MVINRKEIIMGNKRIIKMWTGEFGAHQMGTEITIMRCEKYPVKEPFDDLSEEYRKCRDKLYYLKKDKEKYEKNLIIKFLIWIKAI